MSRRALVWSGSVVAVLLVVGVAVVEWWPDEGAAETENERAFCWKVGARVSAGEGDGSVSACAERLERVGKKDRSALRTVVGAYALHTAKEYDRMPVAVRRALARALGERPELVFESLASDGWRTGLDRSELAFTIRAIAGDDVALRALRSSQEAYAKAQIESLTRADFDKGEDSRHGMGVARTVGRVTGTFTSWAQSGRPDDTRVERGDYYERHGHPRFDEQLVERARAVGVSWADIQNSGSSTGDLGFALESAYNNAANAAEAAARNADAA